MNRTAFDPGELADVQCEAHEGGWTLVFVREMRHEQEKVWAALTEPDQVRHWAPFTASRNLGRVGEATLTMIDGDQREDMPASVTRTEPPRLLEYTWGADRLRWELVPTPAGTTRLTLHHTVTDRDWVPKVAAGWHLCLIVAEHLLDGQPIGPIVGADARNYGWDELHNRYAKTLGIASLGWPE